MIEKGDINDSQVLSATRQEQGQNGSIRFLLTLPSGREINSEWVGPENQKKALFLWLDAAKDQMVLDAEEEAAKAKRSRVPNTQSSPPPAAHPLDDKRMPPARETATVNDPVQHAKDQVTLLEAEERHWLAENQHSFKMLNSVRGKLRKWQTIVASLDAGD